MSVQAMNMPASEKQLAYIKRLSVEMGQMVPEIEKDMSSFEASKLISELIGKGPKSDLNNNKHTINEPRLGMAIKECFKNHTKGGWDIWHHSNNRNRFIKEVIDTYWLFTEIVEKIQKCPISQPSSGNSNEGGQKLKASFPLIEKKLLKRRANGGDKNGRR